MKADLRTYFEQRGRVSYEEICEVFGGEYIYIPKRKINFEFTYKQLRRTLDRAHAIAYIAEHYNYSPRYVRTKTYRYERKLNGK